MMYCIDLVIWLTRLFKFCCVHKTLGPYVTLTGKMLLDMSSFLVILIIVLFSFGVCRQAIYNSQNVDWSSNILWNITHEPYFMLYGEVYAYSIDPCTPSNKAAGMCVPGLVANDINFVLTHLRSLISVCHPGVGTCDMRYHPVPHKFRVPRGTGMRNRGVPGTR